MAPKKGSKRATTTPAAAGRPGKAAKLTPQEEQLQAVAQAIDTVGLPDDCREMLLAVLPMSLGMPSDTRHAVQERIADMVGESLAKALSDKNAAASKASEEATAAEGRQAELQAAQEAQDACARAASEAAQEKKAALNSADAALTEAKAEAAKKAEEEQAAKEAEAAKKAECDDFDALVAEHLGPLKDGTWDEGTLNGQQRVEHLQPALQKADLDASVTASLGISGSKKASERSAFDNMVLEQVATSLHEKAAALRRELAEKGPGLAAATAATAAQAAEVDKAEKAAQECKSTFEQAQAQLQESEAKSRAAAQELKAFSTEAKRAAKGSEAAHSELELFKSGPLAAYEALKNFSSKSAEAAKVATAAAEETTVSVTVGGA
jgi:hypothetical protein